MLIYTGLECDSTGNIPDPFLPRGTADKTRMVFITHRQKIRIDWVL